MARSLVMRQMDEKTTDQEVSLMVWSPKMDILALAFSSGSISLHRLQWQKIWTAEAGGEGEGVVVSALAWRPDGKLLAAGDSSGVLTIRHIEASTALHTEQLDSGVVSIRWQQCAGEELTGSSDNSDWEFLARLPSLSKTYSGGSGTGQEELEDCRVLDSQDTSVLVVGTQAGTIYVLINGYLLCMKLSISEMMTEQCGGVESVVMTPDMKSLCVLTSSCDLIILRCPLLSSCKPQLLNLASKFCFIHGLCQYSTETIRHIKEAWETILLEMDSKLSSYAEKNPPGTVAADFLELLLFGVPTPQLKLFLEKDMTEKSLKKLGNSMEMSYSNIQRLVLRYLGAVSQSLNFQLWEVLGLARMGDKYSVLGVSEELVEAAVTRAQAFWAKGVELQQVLDESSKNFKAFFRWLYVEMLKIHDDSVPGDLGKVSQQDVTFIAEFLKRFQPVEEPGGVTHVHLEKVGQYLGEADLLQLPDRSNNLWCKLVQSNPELANTPFIIPVDSKTSLVKEHELLLNAVNSLFSSVARDLTKETVLLSQCRLPGSSPSSVSQIIDGVKSHGVVTESEDTFVYWVSDCVEAVTSQIRVKLTERIVDSSFYNRELLILLLEGPDSLQSLTQIPLSSLSCFFTPDPTDVPCVSITDLSDVGTREMDSLSAAQLAVSGQRGVSVCLFKNKKRLRIYDMEGEDEDEDEILESSGFSASELTSCP